MVYTNIFSVSDSCLFDGVVMASAADHALKSRTEAAGACAVEQEVHSKMSSREPVEDLPQEEHWHRRDGSGRVNVVDEYIDTRGVAGQVEQEEDEGDKADRSGTTKLSLASSGEEPPLSGTGNSLVVTSAAPELWRQSRDVEWERGAAVLPKADGDTRV